MTQEEDVITEAAKELGMPKEQVHLVVFTFWKTIRYFLANPHLVRGGLFIKGFGRIQLSVQRIETFISRAMFGISPMTPTKQARVDYLKEVLKTKINKYESGQKSSPEDKLQKRSRLEEHIGRERSYVKEGEVTYDLLQYKEHKRQQRIEAKRAKGE